MAHLTAILVSLAIFAGLCFVKTRDEGTAVTLGGMQGCCLIIAILGITGFL